MSFRQILIAINVAAVIAIVVIIVARVISLRRNPAVPSPQNQTEFLDDEELESRRLERSLGWSLLFVAVIAVSLPVYFLFEPSRQSSAEEGFEERAVERGATYYANASMPEYDATLSLLCADCHGADLKGGSAPFVLTSEDATCDPLAEPSADRPECLPQPVTWQAPALDTALLKYSEEQVREIIIFGRPGTPMPPWGLESDEGVLNEQGITDLIAFIESKQISSEDAKREGQDALDGYRANAEDAVESTRSALESAQAALAESPDDEALQRSVTVADANLEWAEAWLADVTAAGDGEILFQINCARCHTKNWSIFDPTTAPLFPWMAPGPQGGGAYGPNLTGGAELRQFPGMTGPSLQYDFVAQGAERDKAYGVRGIASGRMPHYDSMLTQEQIESIVEYERGL